MPALSSMLVDAGWFAAVRDRERTDAVFGAIARELRRRCDDLLDRGSPRYCDMDDLDSFWWRTRIGGKQLVVATWDLAMAVTRTAFCRKDRCMGAPCSSTSPCWGAS